MSRMQKTINLGWKFYRGECTAAWYRGYDDGNWQSVTLPHDWSVKEPFSREHSSGGGYLAGGVGWYRTYFTIPEEFIGMKVWVVFDGVYNNSMVWVNSYYMGKRPNGYATFAYDVTHAARFGKDQTQISVRVDHKHTADSRWFTGSGINRKVSIIVKEPLYIDLNGVFFSTTSVCKGHADIRIRTTVVNETPNNTFIIVRNTLLDAGGKAVAVIEQDCMAVQGEPVGLEQAGVVQDPNLWSPESPYLYTLRTEIISGGQIMDVEETRVGIRTYRFDADKGFLLDGDNIKIKGVCVHDDAGCLGSAVVKKVWERRLHKFKHMGCNAIRMAHNPHMPELYDLCDSMGFFVINEAFDEWEGVKNKWSVGHNVYPPKHHGYYEDFPEWHEKDLRAMVERDRNHPSIILWSIGNEIDYPNDPYCHPLFQEMTGNNDANKPSSEKKYNPNKPEAYRLVTLSRRLYSMVKKSDDTRPVTANLSFPELSNLTGLCDTLDVCGYSYMEKRYEEDHAKYPQRVIMGSENTKDYTSWIAARDCNYISSQFLWTGIDFLGEAYGWPVHGSMAGLLTTAGFEKPVYYFRKSLWSREPFIQLSIWQELSKGSSPWHHAVNESLSWNFTEGDEVQVLCYTNCPVAEILLNGESLGKYRLEDFKEQGYISLTVLFKEGRLEAVGMAASGTRVASSLETTGAAAGIVAVPDCTELKADGEDIAQLEATVVDSAGRWVPKAYDRIYVMVEGAGELLGIENGDLSDNTEYPSCSRRAYCGRLLIYVRAAEYAGPIKVYLSSPGSLGETVVELSAK